MTKFNGFIKTTRVRYENATWDLFRIAVAAMFITHGYGKLLGENPQSFSGSGMTSINIGKFISIPMPFDINALFLAGSFELVGGLLILIGLWTNVVALIAAFTMLMAYLIAHLAWFPTLNNGELAAMYFFSFLILYCKDPGIISIDSWLKSRKDTSA